METNPSKPKIVRSIGEFFLVLLVLYGLWYPISFWYSWFRLKCAYILLNIFGFYPTFDITGINSYQGELFAFLPYLSLMIVTYRKKIFTKSKQLGLTFFIILVVEVLGRFFEKITLLYSPSYFYQTISVFFLGTARVAIPFIAWLFSFFSETDSPL